MNLFLKGKQMKAALIATMWLGFMAGANQLFANNDVVTSQTPPEVNGDIAGIGSLVDISSGDLPNSQLNVTSNEDGEPKTQIDNLLLELEKKLGSGITLSLFDQSKERSRLINLINDISLTLENNVNNPEFKFVLYHLRNKLTGNRNASCCKWTTLGLVGSIGLMMFATSLTQPYCNNYATKNWLHAVYRQCGGRLAFQ